MDKFNEYLRFQDIETAKEYTTVLEKHNIPFELDDASMRFEIVKSGKPDENLFLLKVRDEDIEKIVKFFDAEIAKEIKNLPPEHYLFSFNDNEILDIIANQHEWTRTEVNLALKIAGERNIDLSASSIKSAKKIQEEKKVAKLTIANASYWFWFFGLFSIVNSIVMRTDLKFHFPGLAMTEYLEYIFNDLSDAGNRIGFIACLVIASIFFLFAKVGKGNKWVFAIGLCVLAFDSVLRIFTYDWFSIIFNFIALWYLTNALINTVKAEKSTA